MVFMLFSLYILCVVLYGKYKSCATSFHHFETVYVSLWQIKFIHSFTLTLSEVMNFQYCLFCENSKLRKHFGGMLFGMQFPEFEVLQAYVRKLPNISKML